MLYWEFADSDVVRAGAVPPEEMSLPNRHRAPNSPYAGSFGDRWRKIEKGERVVPSDCPAIRIIARYGIMVRSPGRVVLNRLDTRRPFREFGRHRTRFGIAEIGGDRWPRSDSRFIASWITGSEFVKIQTGILIYFSANELLYQGPLPNACLLDQQPDLQVISGIEPARPASFRLIDGKRYGVAEMNIIVRLPPLGKILRISRMDPLAWVFPVAPLRKAHLARLEAVA